MTRTKAYDLILSLNLHACIFDRLRLSAALGALFALAITLADIGALQVQSQSAWLWPAGSAIIVTPDNFRRAESDLIYDHQVDKGGLGKFVHQREHAPIDSPLVRPSRDTLYSSAVFDLDAGPVTITLPNAGQRFMSMQVIDEDHYTHVVYYGAGSYALASEQIATRYAYVGVRILLDPNDPQDVKAVHALQDAIRVEQENGPGKFEVPDWDEASHTKVRSALLALAATVTDTRHMFGRRDQVDPVRHLIGTAIAFGGNPEKDLVYLKVTPIKNYTATTIYRLAVKDVPVDGFWSISVYNARGQFVKNRFNAHTLNNIRAKSDADGSVAVQFGGCNGRISNCLPTMSGWNYVVRLYRPRAEILNGIWKFPEAQPVQ